MKFNELDSVITNVEKEFMENPYDDSIVIEAGSRGAIMECFGTPPFEDYLVEVFDKEMKEIGLIYYSAEELTLYAKYDKKSGTSIVSEFID